ncbi:MAG: hypothetical protein WD070_11965 [Pirellulaceae bacterium]
MKSKSELQPIIDQIASADSPVGMDAVYVHALILDKLDQLEVRLNALEASSATASDQAEDAY